MAITRIYIEVDEVDGDDMSLGGYGDFDDGSTHVFLADGETVLGLITSLKPYADEHSIEFIEVPVEAVI